MAPSRSRMVALISPTWLVRRMSASSSPRRIRARASFTQTGQRESVVRGQPSTGEVFSQLFGIGAGAHAGVIDPAGQYRAAVVHAVQATFAAPLTAASRTLVKIMS